uniref:Peptidase C14 caspase domain-containing protein n=1 Tax=Aegilops tauschii subsp. strangulata TaxID=200361 RepID=A0A453JCA7_AEGTS
RPPPDCSAAMNCGRGPAPATMVRCRQCSASVAAPAGARAVQCMQCCCVTRVGGAGRQLSVVRPIPNFGGGRGKKRAVLVGIKYTNTRACELRGPINDVKCMRYILTERFGFANDCVLILTDEERDPCRQPTKANIRMAMHWLVQGCSSGDSLVFQFSGAGAQVPDCDGDERDGMDEAICPVDSFQQGPILDDEINQAIVRPLVHGVKLHAIVDACHSATVLDLPYRCTFSKQYGCLRWMDERPLNGACKGTSGGQAVLISGSSNGKTQMSVLPEPNATIGALTHSFIKAVECEPRTTYGHLLTSMRTTMRAGAGNCNLQGPIGCSISKVTNFSGVE